MAYHRAISRKFLCDTQGCEHVRFVVIWECRCCDHQNEQPTCPDHGHMSRDGYIDKLLKSKPAVIHPSERTVVWRRPDGETRFPMRADAPIPKQYAQQGFERVELNTLQDVRRLERETGTMNERANYDKGSGTARPDSGMTD